MGLEDGGEVEVDGVVEIGFKVDRVVEVGEVEVDGVVEVEANGVVGV